MTEPTIDELIAFIERRIQAGTDAEFYRGIRANLERLRDYDKRIDAQSVPEETELMKKLLNQTLLKPVRDHIDYLQSALKLAQEELAALPDWKRRRSEEWKKIGEALNGKISDIDSLKIRLRELDKKGYQPSTGAIGHDSADCLDTLEQRAEKAESALKLAQEERDRHMGAVQAYIEDAEAMKQRAERAEAALKLAQEELEKANNEFGSQTAAWPDLWKRIAEIKQYSGEQWRRAEKAEALAEQFRKDAERYRWLRDSGNFVPSMCGNGWGLGMSSHAATADQLDAAIDSARAE